MSNNIQFNPDEQSYAAPVDTMFPKDSAMIRLVKRLSGGTIKTTEQANYVLLAIAVLFFAGTIIIMMKVLGIGGSSSGKLPYKYREDVPPEIRQELPQAVYNSLPSRTGQ